MPKFQKRPIFVEAMQWTGDNINELWDWAGADNVYGPVDGNPLQLWVAANDVWIDLEISEWIIQDSAGFYPCKARIFEKTYDRVEPARHPFAEIEGPFDPLTGDRGPCPDSRCTIGHKHEGLPHVVDYTGSTRSSA